MPGKKSKVWYSYMGGPYTGSVSPWYDLRGKAWYDELTTNIPEIRREMLALLQQHIDMKTYFNTKTVEKGNWDARGFLSWGLPDKEMIKDGKEVFKYFKDIPGLVLLSISILRPFTHIKAHNGDTDATYRLHIPIIIPAQLPECALRVAGIDKPWPEDKINVFSDAHRHEAWNDTDKARVILIVDVVREELLPDTRTVCANVVALLTMQKLLMRSKLYKTLPKQVKRGLVNTMIPVLKVAARVMLWYKNR